MGEAMNNRRVKFGEDNRKECGFGKYRTSVLCELKAWTNGIARCLFVALYSYAVFLPIVGGGQYLLHGGLLCCNHGSLSISMSDVGLQRTRASCWGSTRHSLLMNWHY